jgi:hypothetical protein
MTASKPFGQSTRTTTSCACRIFKPERTDGEAHPRLARRARVLPSGRRAESARPSSAIDAYDSRCTTKQPNTHNTESRKLLYPWHPWHGRSVWIHQAMVKNGIAIFFCSLEKTAAARLLEIPQWMFDATACYGMHLTPTPAICIETILDLKRLVAQPTSESHEANIRLRHRSAESAGGANAKRPAEWPISAVSDTLAEDSSLGGLTLRVKTTNRSALSTPAASALRKRRRHKTRGGDVR